MNKNTKKVLLLLGSLSDYRVPIYNLINKKYDLTVAYDVKDESKHECYFKKLKVIPDRKSDTE